MREVHPVIGPFPADNPEALSRLHLVGTIHCDSEGLRKSMRLLQSVQPDLVLVELSRYGRAFRRRHGPSLQRTFLDNLRKVAADRALSFKKALKHPQVAAIRRQISLPFEYRAAAAYTRDAPARLLLVDSSRFSRNWISTWPELISKENLENLLRLPSDNIGAETSRFAYRRAAREIQGNATAAPLGIVEESSATRSLWQQRECYLAARIRDAVRKMKPCRAIYLGGWRHLTSGGKFLTLRDLLEIDRTRCHLLDQDSDAKWL